MDQNGSSRRRGTGEPTGAGQAAGANLSVYEAEPGTAPRDPHTAHGDSAQNGPAQASAGFGPSYRDGFTGSLALQGAESLTQDEAGAVLSRLDALMRWAQAQQAKVLHRMETVFRDDLLEDVGREDPGLTFSLAAEEAAAILHLPTNTAILHLPTNTAKMLMSDAGRLCSTHTATLTGLEQGTCAGGAGPVPECPRG
ncbi:hypothetical protein [Arthrobacter gengyunqii]|uniref:HNH endonuclease n=1 Tax=Arthrobacter gengyunqii TaxID=2886940 RepID=A0ABS8GEH8_9MICC|nr:hypothetical protein [Arthrobacter gengyunqii]MCC3264876.1 hypothetical protein [Arthrobacter gengyunqii]